jgi:hypothetical protein
MAAMCAASSTGSGDAAALRKQDGQELRMACASGMPSGQHAARSIAARLAGLEPTPMRFRYLNHRARHRAGRAPSGHSGQAVTAAALFEEQHMTLINSGDTKPLLVRAAEAETLGIAPDTMHMLADGDPTDGAVSFSRTKMGKDTEGASPHYHSRAAESFFIISGGLHVLTESRSSPPAKVTSSWSRRTPRMRSAPLRTPAWTCCSSCRESRASSTSA